jgi:hypothetical protein
VLYAESMYMVKVLKGKKDDKLWKIAIEFDHTLSCWLNEGGIMLVFFIHLYIICGREMWWRSIFSLIAHTDAHIESVCMISRLEMIYEHVAIKERYSLRQWKLL